MAYASLFLPFASLASKLFELRYGLARTLRFNPWCGTL